MCPGFSSIWSSVHVAACCHDQPMTRTSKLVAAGVLLLALAACGSSTAAKAQVAPKTFTVSGQLTLNIGSYIRADDTSNSQCSGFEGYSDIQAGAQVVIYDATGKIVGNSTLADGQMYSDSACGLGFTVVGVPAGAGPYSIEVSHRGKSVFTQAQASDVELTLGS